MSVRWGINPKMLGTAALRYLCKGPSQTNTGPLRPRKKTPRVTQVPLRPTECSGQIESLHALKEGLCSPTECPLRFAQGIVRPTKDLLALQGLVKSSSGRQFTQACKGNSQVNSGPAQADKGPSRQHGILSDRQNAILGQQRPS